MYLSKTLDLLWLRWHRFLQVLSTILKLVFWMMMSSCASQMQSFEADLSSTRFPKWYVNPPTSTSTELYGVGEGKDRQEAMLSALAQIATQLRVTLSTQVESHVELKHGIETEQRLISSHMEVIPLELEGYEVLKQEVLHPLKALVLVRVYRQKLARDLHRMIERNLSDFQTRLEQSKHRITLLKTCTQIRALLPKLQNRVELLSTLEPSVASFDRGLKTIKSQCMKGGNAWRIFLVDPITESERLVDASLSTIFTTLGFQVLRPQRHLKSELNCRFKVHEDLSKPMGFMVVRWSVKIDLLEDSHLEASHLLEVIGQSATSVQHARQVAQEKLKKEIQSLGIYQLFAITD